VRNKKGEEILFFWLVFIWIVIGVGIVGGVYVFYSAEINTKSLESDILNSRIIDCVVKSGESDSSLIGEEIFNLCVLDEKIKNLSLENHVVTTGYIGSADLSSIFRQADAYVFPSLSEGFGIPGLNAMASGLPVAASDIPVLKEVYGQAAAYFDPKNPQDIARKIKSVLGSSKVRSDLITKGNEQVKKYSWLKMAKETLEVYKQTT